MTWRRRLAVLVLGAILCTGCGQVAREPTASIEPNGVEVALCRDVSSRCEPLDETDQFDPLAPAIHCVVRLPMPRWPQSLGVQPKGVVKAVFVAEDAIDQPNYVIETLTTTVRSEGAVDLCIYRDDRPWPEGRYRVDVYVGEHLVRSTPFTVTTRSVVSTAITRGTDVAESTRRPSPTATCTPLATVAPEALPLRIAGAVVAHGVDAETMAPVTPTFLFGAETEAFYYVVRVVDVTRPVELTARWSVVEAGGLAQVPIKETVHRVTDDSVAAFALSRGEQPWPTGRYIVALCVDGRVARVDPFVVEAP